MFDIEVINFSKAFKDITAVDNISFNVNRGELFGLIGPDGSGKTTLMRTLATLLLPTAGTLHIKNMDVTQKIMAIRSILGYMPQRFSLYQDLSVEQNLHFFADLFQVSQEERGDKLEQLYNFSRLGPFKNRQAGALSGGMKQKLALSCALIHTPEILLLDEPTFGVDPVSRYEFWNILHSIQKNGTTILVSTAYMDEANQCDRVALFFDGKIKAIDSPSTLRQQYPHPLYLIEAMDIRKITEKLGRFDLIHTVQMFGDTLHVSFLQDPDDDFWRRLESEEPGQIKNRQKIDPSIEDIFLNLMEVSE